jgi:hypothetical protein
MATTSSSNSSTFVLPNLASFTNTKLMGIVDGLEPCPPQFVPDDQGKDVLNPEYSLWNKKDQFILSWLNTTLNESVLSTLYGLHTSQQVWNFLATRFALQSRTRVTHLRRELQSIRQGSKTCSAYLQEAKNLANQLAAIGKPTDDEDLISFIISGLNPTFNTFVTTFIITTKDKLPTFTEFQDELLNHEALINQQQAATTDVSNFALFAQHQGGSSRQNFQPFNRKSKGVQHSKYSPRPATRFSQSPIRFSPPTAAFSRPAPQMTSPVPITPVPHRRAPLSHGSFQPNPQIPCQICGKISHQALDCFHRMDYAYQGRHPPTQLAAMTAQTNTELDDQQWFADSGANSHITNELENLSLQQQPFKGNEAVAVGDGGGLEIENTGSAILTSFNSRFHLTHILHCPKAATNLLSIQKLCKDNDCYFILTDSHFFVKELNTHRLLLEGRSENGLYPLRSRLLFVGLRTTLSVWHYRLGHSSFLNVNRVLKAHDLPVSNDDSNKNPFCDSC